MGWIEDYVPKQGLDLAPALEVSLRRFFIVAMASNEPSSFHETLAASSTASQKTIPLTLKAR